MSEKPPEQTNQTNRWATPVTRIKMSDTDVQEGAINLNVDGKKITGPVQGFGQMWQKTYKIKLKNSAVTPQTLIKIWKEKFPEFWPEGNHFYSRSSQIEPGQVAVLNLSGPNGMTTPGGGPLISTGVVVVYADDFSFSFMTPEGHMFAGMITFSSFKEEDTIAQIQALVRASDPMYELTFRLGLGHKMEDEFWMETLKNLAHYFQSSENEPEMSRVIVDPRLQWKKAKNIWQNAAIRTTLYTLATPVRWVQAHFHKE